MKRQIRQYARKARRVYYSHGLSPVSARVHARHRLADSVTVVASKRTGSTWVQELLSSGPGSAPCSSRSRAIPGFASCREGPEEVIAPDEEVPDLEAFLAAAMRGAHLTRWSMRLASQRQLLTADRFVVKHVQLCRAAGWLGRTFPETPMVVVVRHPCAVVQSMLTVRWSGSTEAEILAKRPESATRLAIEILDGRSSPAEVFAALWASEMLAMLGETDPAQASLVAYESVVDDPVATLGPIMEQLRIPRPADLWRPPVSRRPPPTSRRWCGPRAIVWLAGSTASTHRIRPRCSRWCAMPASPATTATPVPTWSPSPSSTPARLHRSVPDVRPGITRPGSLDRDHSMVGATRSMSSRQ